MTPCLDLEVVTHCWSGDEVPIYHHLLKYQLTSLLTNNHRIQLSVRLFLASDDEATEEVVRYFQPLFDRSTRTRLVATRLDRAHLFRRGIGRHMAALETKADVVWFTDCDHVFKGSCLDAARMECLKSPHPLVYPSWIYKHAFHKIGDELIQDCEENPNPFRMLAQEGFTKVKNKRAIGGIQIVKGDWCRDHGYCTDKYLVPVDPEKGFQQCHCDRSLRAKVGRSEAVEINGVYRLRHSLAGRDGGTKNHGKSK